MMTDRNDYAETELNIALLIDADNASPEHLDEVLLVLGELGTINIRRAYGPRPASKAGVSSPACIRSFRCSNSTW
jgi:hypothetical protein